MYKFDHEKYEEAVDKTKNSQMAIYSMAADELGINHKMIIRALLIEFQKDGKTWRIHKSLTPINNAVATAIASYKTTCGKFLYERGFPVPKQSDVKSAKEITTFKKMHSIEEIVIKPKRGVGGYGVTILPKNEKEIEQGFKKAYDHCLSHHKTKVIVEEFISGKNYRLLILDDEVIAAAHRVAAFIIGDGKHSVEALIEQKNKILEKENRPLIKVDRETTLALRQQELQMQSIPEKDQKVRLRFNANMSTGGSTRECLDEVDETYKEVAIEAVKNVGLKLAGVDLITPDITKPVKNYGINEINHNPGLRIHYLPDEGQAVNVAYDIQKYILNNL
jgi:D-alanine-D-alanine ligase-like ATP-grasp enzyme